MIKQTIRYYLGFEMAFAFAFSFLMAVYVMFLIGRGLSLLEINLVNLSFFLTKAVFEVPTGIFADAFGRKLSFVSSCLVVAFDKIIYVLSHSISGFIVAEMVIAIGVTFASGAFQAWLVDRLDYYGHTEPIDDVYAKKNYLVPVAQIFGSIIGAYLADISRVLPWLISAGFMVLVAISAQILLKEEYRRPKQKKPFKRTLSLF